MGKEDPDVTTKENELMIEYYKRVAFAEENFLEVLLEVGDPIWE